VRNITVEFNIFNIGV